MAAVYFSKVRRWVNDHKGRRYKTEYELVISENRKDLKQVLDCDRKTLVELKQQLEMLLAEETTAEVLDISEKEGEILDDHYKNDLLCRDCSYKKSFQCLSCIFVCQSPLERMLYVAMSKEYIKFEMQYALDWNGDKIYIDNTTDPKHRYSKVLTIPDFFIQKKGLRLCIYTDGHNYHSSEERLTKDKKQDRKLQELGFVVLRFTGKEIKEELPMVVNTIKGWVEKAYAY